MPADLPSSPEGVVGVGNRISAGRTDWSHWANTLADSLPGGAARDIDGDRIPDEPQALSAVKSVGGAIAGTAGSVGASVAGLFKRKRRDKQTAGGSETGGEEVFEN
ncbi:hypothetical protein PJ267_09330 [Arthrobacter sp. OVS8]|nr:hypothetical protein PJ267_09330 [Arthrobacter sp. OVS8]